MKHRTRRQNSLALPALVLLLCAVFSGCSNGSDDRRVAENQQVVLGFSPIVSWGDWNGANAESIRKAAQDANVELRLEDARHSQEKQVAALRSYIDQRVDVIAFSPVVANGWELVLGEARRAGIPVILMDRAIESSDESLYVSQIGSDFVEQGRRAGRWLLERTRDMPGEFDIVELQGTVGSAPTNDRKQGFSEVIATDPRFHIIRSQTAEFDLARARVVMEGFLELEGRRIRVVFAHNDSMALGAIEAMEAAGLKPGTEILVLSIEGSRKGLEAIVAGKLNMAVECSPLLGPPLIAVVKDLAAGKTVSRRVVTKESVFTRENAAMELPNRAY
jgi:ABC-type sugar transport system substrate-binding protein